VKQQVGQQEKKMKQVCAWCKKIIGGDSNSSESDNAPISHGICQECVRMFFAGKIMPLSDYLESFAGAVLLVNSDARVMGANSRGLSLLGKKLEQVEGQLGGDAFECRYASLPGGCGQTIHCKTCTIRQTVTHTMTSGQSHERVPAYPDLHHISGDKRLKFFISTEKMGDAVLLRIDEVSEEPR
jgi:hypothetical protein